MAAASTSALFAKPTPNAIKAASAPKGHCSVMGKMHIFRIREAASTSRRTMTPAAMGAAWSSSSSIATRQQQQQPDQHQHQHHQVQHRWALREAVREAVEAVRARSAATVGGGGRADQEIAALRFAFSSANSEADSDGGGRDAAFGFEAASHPAAAAAAAWPDAGGGDDGDDDEADRALVAALLSDDCAEGCAMLHGVFAAAGP